MTDQELLELAANAACLGYAVENYAELGEFENGWGMVKNIGEFWNPLTDDGDALRLAVKLKITIDVAVSFVACCWENDGLTEDIDSDPYAATRRAIVRAAAEIGKAMPGWSVNQCVENIVDRVLPPVERWQVDCDAAGVPIYSDEVKK